MRFGKIPYAIVTTVILFSGESLLAQSGGIIPVPTSVTYQVIEARSTGVDGYFKIPTTGTHYPNNCSCGVTEHTTKKPVVKRYFEHYHYPDLLTQGASHITMTGTSGSGTLMIVSRDTVKNFWDNHYGNNYTSSSAENSSYNCWGYALGYSVWVNDPVYIYEDDYDSITNPVDDCVIRENGHIITVVKAEEVIYVYKIREKNRSSRVYSRTFDPPPGTSSYSGFYKKK